MSVETAPPRLPHAPDRVVGLFVGDARGALDWEIIAGGALLLLALMIGLLTAGDYGVSIDEFNADDYGPKALAWYTSGFTDRSHFETVEWSLWYYGPWFHALTAFVQSLGVADHFTVRHVMTFLAGLGGIAALLPLGRLTAGRWAGFTAVTLCLLTGYLYGSLFFTPIDVPFLAAMTWAVLAIVVMTRETLPSWGATVVAGLAIGLAIATRTGGIIAHVYLLGALGLCAIGFFAEHGRLTPRYLLQLAARFAGAVAVSALVAIALWPWLQIGNPLTQFMIAFTHFGHMSMVMPFAHWGQEVWTNALPATYIPAQLAARLPEGFLVLLGVAAVAGVASLFGSARAGLAQPGVTSKLRMLAETLARYRAIIVVVTAVVLPVGYMIARHTTHYDGIRHVLFIIPMLAVIAGAGFAAALPLLRRAARPFAVVGVLYAGYLVLTLVMLHPLEYVAMNALAGGTYGAYGRFELDYFTVAPTTALRRLEARLTDDPSIDWAANPPSITVCIPWRETMVGPLLRKPWRIEPDRRKADFVIESERYRCAEGLPFTLIDEVKRLDRSFAWTYVRRPVDQR